MTGPSSAPYGIREVKPEPLPEPSPSPCRRRWWSLSDWQNKSPEHGLPVEEREERAQGWPRDRPAKVKTLVPIAVALKWPHQTRCHQWAEPGVKQLWKSTESDDFTPSQLHWQVFQRKSQSFKCFLFLHHSEDAILACMGLLHCSK